MTAQTIYVAQSFPVKSRSIGEGDCERIELTVFQEGKEVSALADRWKLHEHFALFAKIKRTAAPGEAAAVCGKKE